MQRFMWRCINIPMDKATESRDFGGECGFQLGQCKCGHQPQCPQGMRLAGGMQAEEVRQDRVVSRCRGRCGRNTGSGMREERGGDRGRWCRCRRG